MGPFEIILIIVCVAIVVGVCAASIIRKKKGKSSCDCGGDCSCCSHCSYGKTANVGKDKVNASNK